MTFSGMQAIGLGPNTPAASFQSNDEAKIASIVQQFTSKSELVEQFNKEEIGTLFTNKEFEKIHEILFDWSYLHLHINETSFMQKHYLEPLGKREPTALERTKRLFNLLQHALHSK